MSSEEWLWWLFIGEAIYNTIVETKYNKRLLELEKRLGIKQ